MWRRTCQRLMGRGCVHVMYYIRKGERRKEISHSALLIVDVLADVKHVHDLQGVSEVIARRLVRSIESPDRECSSVFSTVTPIDREDDIKPFRFAFAITETFLEDPCKWRVIRVHTTPSIRKGWIRIIGVVKGGRGWRTIPIG